MDTHVHEWPHNCYCEDTCLLVRTLVARTPGARPRACADTGCGHCQSVIYGHQESVSYGHLDSVSYGHSLASYGSSELL